MEGMIKEAEGGLSADELALRAQGHKGELPRQFSTLSALSLRFVITNSWIGLCATFVTPLQDGGGPTVFFGLIAAAIACTLITVGLAELASAFPSSGGQYHFAFMVSSPKTRALAAFVTGWLSTLAWCLTATSADVYCAQIVLSLASLWNPDYAPTQWQTYLINLVFLLLSVCIVCYLPKALPKIDQFFFWSSLLGFLVSFVTMLASSKTKQPAKPVFTQYTNQTGWSDGMAFIIGVGQCMYTFLATDAATHIAEEVPKPGRNIPRVMWLTQIIGILTSIPFLLAMLFSSDDLGAIAASSLPILEVYFQATGSKAATTVLTTWLLLNYTGASIGCYTIAGRLAWAFSRDNGLPASKFFATIHSSLQAPVNATLGCAAFCVFYGLIYVGSTTAFNSIISLAILSLNVTYALPQGIALIRGRDAALPQRDFNLGRFGSFVNAFSCLWVVFYTVIFSLPFSLPVTAQNLNYVSVVVAGVAILIASLWIGGKKKTFVGPNIEEFSQF